MRGAGVRVRREMGVCRLTCGEGRHRELESAGADEQQRRRADVGHERREAVAPEHRPERQPQRLGAKQALARGSHGQEQRLQPRRGHLRPGHAIDPPGGLAGDEGDHARPERGADGLDGEGRRRIQSSRHAPHEHVAEEVRGRTQP